MVSVIKKPISDAGVVVKTLTMHVKNPAQHVVTEGPNGYEVTTGRIKKLQVTG